MSAVLWLMIRWIKGAGLTGILCWTVAAGPWFAGEASAKAPEWGLDLGRSSGHVLEVSTKGHKVEVLVSRGLASTSYVTSGRVSEDRVFADLGPFGEIRGRFVPSKRVLRQGPAQGCSGPPAVVRFGHFEGIMRFRGEAGYVQVRRSSVPGARRNASWDCSVRNEKEAREPKLRNGVSGIEARSASGRIFFAALSTRNEDAITSFVMEARGRVKKVEIRRRALSIAGPSAYVVSDVSDEVTVAPPAPFHGEATLSSLGGFEGVGWNGTLRVAVPGMPRLSLVHGMALVGELKQWGIRRLDRILESL